MSTPIASTAGRGRRAAWAVGIALAAAGLLAAGCGTTKAGSAANGTTTAPTSTAPSAGGTASGGTAAGTAPGRAPSGGASGGAPGSSPAGPAPSAPAASATPVPTVSGGTVPTSQPACAGWPASAPTASLPVSFVPVSVERCVNSAQQIAGKGLWVTATLQRADGNLTALVNALHQPAGVHRPGTACPALAMIPPQIVLISGSGKLLIPRLPSTGCGLTQSTVLAALNTLSWHPVSVRLISKVPATGTGPTVTGSPRSYQTVGGVAPQ
jgi:hypothetical protein